MAIETKYTCDRCGYSSPEHEDLWNVAVVAAPMPQMLTNSYTNQRITVLWCRPCCDLFNFIKVEPPKPGVPELTNSEKLEQIIREIAVEAAEEHVTNF